MNKSFGLIKFVHQIVSWVRCLIEPVSNVIFVFYEKHIFEMTPTYISLVSFSFKSTNRTQNVLNWLFYTGLLVKKIPILQPALRAKLGRVTSNKAFSDWDLWMKANSQWVSLNGSAECVTTAAPVLSELISGPKHTEPLLTQRALSAVNKCFSLSKSISSHCVPFEGRPTILLFEKEK